jgi:hypothetical protein
VLNTHLSSGMSSVSMKRRYRYFKLTEDVSIGHPRVKADLRFCHEIAGEGISDEPQQQSMNIYSTLASDRVSTTETNQR